MCRCSGNRFHITGPPLEDIAQRSATKLCFLKFQGVGEPDTCRNALRRKRTYVAIPLQKSLCNGTGSRRKRFKSVFDDVRYGHAAGGGAAGAVPFGAAAGLHPLEAMAAAVAGNLPPVPLSLLLLRRVFRWLRRIPCLGRQADRLERRAH